MTFKPDPPVSRKPDNSGWISVLEEPPEPFTDMLWHIPNHGRRKARTFIGYLGSDGAVQAHFGRTREAVYWQPLPAIPVVDYQKHRR